MFTVEEESLLRRMLRIVGLIGIFLIVAVAWFLLRRFHPFHHLALSTFAGAGGGCIRSTIWPSWGLPWIRRGKAKLAAQSAPIRCDI